MTPTAMMNSIGEIARAAFGYATDHGMPITTYGLPIFPLHPIIDGQCGCIERGCTNAGKHPAGSGWQRSIASPTAALAMWPWNAKVERGIGIALGPRARMWALDIDPAHGGDESLARLVAEHGALPATWEVATGGGGFHLYWAWPDDDGEPIRNHHGVIGAGLDIKGMGGFTVAPPSMHVSGHRYRWVDCPGDWPAPAPAWLVELARTRSRSSSCRRDRDGEELVLRAGNRHDQLMRFCATLRSIGLGEAAIVECGHALLKHHAVDDDPNRPIDLRHAETVMRDVARRYRPDGWRT